MTVDQNSYSAIQYCIRCHQPLEKARTMNVGKGVCRACQKKHASEYIKGRKDKKAKILK